MPPPTDLLAAIDSLQPRVWSGTAYRHVAPGRNALSGAGARMFGGRWNPRDLFGAIYLALPQETAVEEFRRMASGQAKGTTSFLPRSLVTVTVPPTRILDMTSPEAASATGLGLQEIASDDWGPCQEVAQAAHFLQFQGILAPSASSSGLVIVVFEDRVPLGHLRVSSQEDLSTHLRPEER